MAERDLSVRRNYPAYEEDYAAWLEAQMSLMRNARFDELDLENLIDEVNDLGVSNYKSFVSAIRIVLLHMLKWDIQEDHRSRSWSDTIEEHQRRVLDELESSPSYRSRAEAAVTTAYRQARATAAAETRLPLRSFPETCPFSWEEIIRREHFRAESD